MSGTSNSWAWRTIHSSRPTTPITRESGAGETPPIRWYWWFVTSASRWWNVSVLGLDSWIKAFWIIVAHLVEWYMYCLCRSRHSVGSWMWVSSCDVKFLKEVHRMKAYIFSSLVGAALAPRRRQDMGRGRAKYRKPIHPTTANGGKWSCINLYWSCNLQSIGSGFVHWSKCFLGLLRLERYESHRGMFLVWVSCILASLPIVCVKSCYSQHTKMVMVYFLVDGLSITG